MSREGPVDDRLHRRCTWLNTNVFWEGAIDRSAIVALSSISFPHAMGLCQDIEEKGPGNIGNPSAYITKAVRQQWRHQEDQEWYADSWRHSSSWEWEHEEYMDNTIHKRSIWLNTNVFWEYAISYKAIVALSRLSVRRALELLAEVESKADRVFDPSNFILKAVGRELPGYESYEDRERWGSSASRYSENVDDRLHRRCTWLNAKVFWPGAIDEDAIASLSTIEYWRAMEMLNDIEKKGPDRLAHPSSYLTASVRHEHEDPWYKDERYWSAEASRKYTSDVIHRRCTWLNSNVFWAGAISDAAIESLSELEVWRALEILKDLEWKSSEVKNPSKWVQATSENQWPEGSYIDNRIHRRCVWLNANVFWQDAIDEEAIRAISSLDYPGAMNLCNDLEAKGSENVSDPSRYLKTAVRREWSHGGAAYES